MIPDLPPWISYNREHQTQKMQSRRRHRALSLREHPRIPINCLPLLSYLKKLSKRETYRKINSVTMPIAGNEHTTLQVVESPVLETSSEQTQPEAQSD